MRSICPALAIH